MLFDTSASKSQEPLPTSAKHFRLPERRRWDQPEIPNPFVLLWSRRGPAPFNPSPPHPARVGLHVSWCSQRFCRSSPRLPIPSQSSAGTLLISPIIPPFLRSAGDLLDDDGPFFYHRYYTRRLEELNRRLAIARCGPPKLNYILLTLYNQGSA